MSDRRRSAGGHVGIVFNPHDAKYRCCFGWCHIKLGVALIGAVECCAAIISAALSFEAYVSLRTHRQKSRSTTMTPPPDEPKNQPNIFVLSDETFLLISAIASVIMAAAMIVAVTLTLWAISKNRRYYLIPHIVLQIVSAIALMALIGLFSWAVVTANRVHRDENLRRWERENRGMFYEDELKLSLISMALSFIVELHFIRVTRRCYQYLKRRILYDQVASFAIKYGGGQPK